MMKRCITQSVILLLVSVPTLANAGSTNWLEDASTLLKNNEPAKAIEILEPEMENHAGELQYDFLLGQAALANEQPNLAAFALERAILSNPKQDGARYTLARAYVELGEIKQARKELNYIVKTSNSSRYKKLSANLAGRLQTSNNTKYNFVVKTGFGTDSNANSATENENFLGITLNKNSQATSSSTLMAQMTAGVNVPLSKKINFNAHADSFKLDYQDADFVNTTATSVGSGLNFKSSKNNQENVQVFARYVEVNDVKNSQQFGAQLTHKYSINKKNQFNISLRGAQTNYASVFSIKDVKQISGGLQYQHKTRSIQKDFIGSSMTAIAGKDLPISENKTYQRTYVGAQAGVFLSDHQGKVNIIANVNYMNSSYSSNFFGQERSENSISSTLKVDIKLHSKWKVSPNISYTRNLSSIDLYDYERAQMSISLSYQVI